MKTAEQWLKKAENDFETAKFNEDNGKHEYAAFLYQQATEKALKYKILKQGKHLPKIHDCYVLSKKAKAPEDIQEKADLVTPYYFRTRYPDAGNGKIKKEETTQLRTATQEIIKWTRKNSSKN